MTTSSASSRCLATFDDRWAVRYVRLLPAPVHRVWQAVTSSEQLNLWFVPVARVEAKLGGRCAFSWGEPEAADEWTVTELDPPKLIQYTADGAGGGQYLRFELEAIDAKTRLCFIQAYGPEHRMPAHVLESEDKGFSRPAGEDTSWCPGILAGYELACDALVAFLEDGPTEDRIREVSDDIVTRANAREPLPSPYVREGESYAQIVDLYYEHIRDACPPVVTRAGTR